MWKATVRRINLRKVNPACYQSIMAMSIAQIFLAINYWIRRPLFNPYDISENVVGAVLMSLGLWKIIFLNWNRDLCKVRLGLSISSGIMLCYGLMYIQIFFKRNGSFQISILYISVAVLEMICLLETHVYPKKET